MAIQPSQLRADTEEFKAEIDRRVDDAYEKGGFTSPDRDGLPQRDNSLLRVAMATKLGEFDVASKGDRHEHAGREVAVVGELFPTVRGPGAYENEEDEDVRLYDAAVWSKLVQLVEAQLRTASLATMVLEMYGRSICAVVLHPNDQPTKMLYITKDWGCLLQDSVGPRQGAIRRAQEAYVKAMRPLIMAHPEHGKRLISEFKKANNRLLDTSVGQLQLTLQMSNGNGDGDDDEADE